MILVQKANKEITDFDLKCRWCGNKMKYVDFDINGGFIYRCEKDNAEITIYENEKGDLK